jgi:hypothetical protein
MTGKGAALPMLLPTRLGYLQPEVGRRTGSQWRARVGSRNRQHPDSVRYYAPACHSLARRGETSTRAVPDNTVVRGQLNTAMDALPGVSQTRSRVYIETAQGHMRCGAFRSLDHSAVGTRSPDRLLPAL